MGKSGSSSQANQTTTTNAADKRVANDSGIVATEGSAVNLTTNTNTYVQSLDAGIVDSAMKTVQMDNATNGEGFRHMLDTHEDSFSKLLDTTKSGESNLLDMAGQIFGAATKLIGDEHKSTVAAISSGQTAVFDSLATLQNDSRGAIDQKTIMVVAIAGAVTLFAISRKK